MPENLRKLKIERFNLANFKKIIEKSAKVDMLFYAAFHSNGEILQSVESKVMQGGAKFKRFDVPIKNLTLESSPKLKHTIHSYFYDANILKKRLSYMNNVVDLEINYGEVETEDGETIMFADSIIVQDEKLKQTINCYDYEVVKSENDPRIRPSNKVIAQLLNDGEKAFKCELTASEIKDIKNNFDIDDSKIFDFKWNKEGLFTIGQNYEFMVKEINEVSFTNEGSARMSKKSFNILDEQNYEFTIFDNRTVYKNEFEGDCAMISHHQHN